MGRIARGAIVAGYILVFWCALPTALWWLARLFDEKMGWAAEPAPLFGGLMLAAGLGVMAMSMIDLWRYGGGLPVSALPPPRLATRGIYATCRHPIYVGFNLFLLGLGWWVGSRGLASVISPAFLPVWLIYALVEERGLEERFGQQWIDYRRRVGLLPRPWRLFSAPPS